MIPNQNSSIKSEIPSERRFQRDPYKRLSLGQHKSEEFLNPQGRDGNYVVHSEECNPDFETEAKVITKSKSKRKDNKIATAIDVNLNKPVSVYNVPDVPSWVNRDIDYTLNKRILRLSICARYLIMVKFCLSLVYFIYSPISALTLLADILGYIGARLINLYLVIFYLIWILLSTISRFTVIAITASAGNPSITLHVFLGIDIIWDLFQACVQVKLLLLIKNLNIRHKEMILIEIKSEKIPC